MNSQKIMTICFLIKKKDGKIIVCLAEKKRGFRAGLFGGYGGKQELGESLEECAVRETWEESGVRLKELVKVGEIYFYGPEKTNVCHAFTTKLWDGDLVETEEMKAPIWCSQEDIPYEKMEQTDPIWMPLILRGSRFVAMFEYDEAGNVYHQDIRELSDIEHF